MRPNPRKGINSRAKGSSFERKIAHEIISAFACTGITVKDCYRTPLSGGHFAASKTDAGDLVMSPALRRFFPYSVECKHYRNIDFHHILVEVISKKGQIPVWWQQCRQAADATGQHPLLIFHANGRETYAMATLDRTPAAKITPSASPYIVTEIGNVRVIVMRWKRFLGRTVYHSLKDKEGLLW